MSNYYTKNYDMPFGRLYTAFQEDRIFAISFLPLQEASLITLQKKRKHDHFTPDISHFNDELKRYCRGENPNFRSGIRLFGSDFEHAVWKACMHIPYGRTCSYGELALAIGNKGSARAVGNALAANPLPIIVPCHRVLRTGGSLGGFGGGAALKKQLLTIEKGET
ncbi:MAG: methylated-DNA--[protein]-cysteine S-methyltransferase [Candidatus Marinimicrobia bacterium]|nr:methylated-DNA--[protein]-cysteine S-methyltransferase [Candidatus Neomarinimicrobiota bacterium]